MINSSIGSCSCVCSDTPKGPWFLRVHLYTSQSTQCDNEQHIDRSHCSHVWPPFGVRPISTTPLTAATSIVGSNDGWLDQRSHPLGAHSWYRHPWSFKTTKAPRRMSSSSNMVDVRCRSVATGSMRVVQAGAFIAYIREDRVYRQTRGHLLDEERSVARVLAPALTRHRTK